MKKIYEILQLPVKKGDVGIEIECEGKRISLVETETWTTTHDGSLRGRYPDESAEFVLRNPIPIKDVKEAIKELVNSQKEAEFNFSFRTSVHVHVNVQNLTENQLINLIYTYLLIEEPLMNFCGKDRKCNRFCLRLQDAENILETVNELIRNGVEGLRYIREDTIRYSALNLAAVSKYGSVEFRGMRGTMDMSVLLPWINACVAIRKFAEMVESPKAIYEMYVDKGAKEFLNTVLGEFAKPFIYQKMDKDIQRSFSLSIDLPYYYSENKKKKEVENELIEKAPVKVPRRRAAIIDPPIMFNPDDVVIMRE